MGYSVSDCVLTCGVETGQENSRPFVLITMPLDADYFSHEVPVDYPFITYLP